MPEKLTEFDAAEFINTEERARLYLEAAADEDPGDGSLIRAALNDIARARNMSSLARDAKLDRAGLYKALSEDGNPSFTTVMKITRALGLKLRLEPDEKIARSTASSVTEASQISGSRT